MSSGEYPIYLRFNQGQKVSSISLDISCKLSAWNDSRLRVTSKDPLHVRKNKKITRTEAKAVKIIDKYEREEKYISINEFKRQLKNINFGNECFFTFAEEYILDHSSEIKPGTLKVLNDQVKKIKSFQTDVVLGEIDGAFLNRYEKFLKEVRGNNSNTVIKAMGVLKQLLIRAHKLGLISQNPFSDYPLGRIEGKRQFLSEVEIGRLTELYKTGQLGWNLKNVLRYFLFACYTGLTFGDVRDFRKRDIDYSHEMPLIDTTRNKTGTDIIVPIRPEALQLMPGDISYDGQKIFKVQTDQSTNRNLKKIMKLAKIDKLITFHCARHTFATLSKSKGIEFDVIAKYLGHTDTKTTGIYAKYEREFLISEAKKWS